MENTIKKMLKEVCSELGIKCTLLSKDWIFMLEKDNKTRFLAGYKSSLNDHAVGQVLDDKYALFEVLKTIDIPVADYNLVYGPKIKEDYAQDCNSFEYVKKYFFEHNQYVVLKPNDGTCGRDVYRVDNLEDLESLYTRLTNKYFSINVGPYYNIKNEYRFIVFDDEVRIAYKKNKPLVAGDGVSTIRDLLLKFNNRFFKDILDDTSYDRVLDVGEVFEYNWKFNLSQGAVATEIDDNEIYEKLKSIALKASKDIGLRFGSVDIIVTEDDKAMILEMNSGVMVENYIEQFEDGYDNAKKLYKDVIIEMFRN